MTTLTEIRNNEPNQALIERLEVMLADARAGDIRGFVGVVIFNDLKTSDCWVQPPYHRSEMSLLCDRMVGCLERIKFQLLEVRE